ncbi:MAG: hypothetical protein ACKO6K_04205, partial [Chitinophagaceae bacterium]
MKTILLLFISLVTGHTLLAQQQPEMRSSPQTDYLAKSRTSRTVGFVFLGGGAALTTGGIIASNNSDTDFSGVATAVVGIGCMLASVPFFVIASYQSSKAARLSGGIKMEKNSMPINSTQLYAAYPAVALQFLLP